MTSDSASLVLSIAGLILGLISAWQQIKSFFFKAARHGGSAAKSWLLKEQALVELYLDQPATLIAYLGKSSVSVFLFLIALLYIRPGLFQQVFHLSAGISNMLYLIPACLIGTILGSISNRCSDVIKLAAKRKSELPAD